MGGQPGGLTGGRDAQPQQGLLPDGGGLFSLPFPSAHREPR